MTVETNFFFIAYFIVNQNILLANTNTIELCHKKSTIKTLKLLVKLLLLLNNTMLHKTDVYL